MKSAAPGRRSQSLARRAETVLFPNYGSRKLAFAKGQGSYLWDVDGRKYLDFLGGIAVTALGHGHPAVTGALREQAGRLLHTSNLYLIEPQIRLAEELVRRSFADRAFFCNSGTEAIEAAIKMVRRVSAQRGSRAREIVVAQGAFHGRTYGALSATPQSKYHEGFRPLVSGFRAAPFGDLAAFEKLVGPKTCAVLIEPVQGEGGVNVPPQGFLRGLRRLCDRQKIPLVFDEIQIGMGRSGKLFAYEHYGVEPDAMTLAKALGNGVPIGVLLTRENLAQVMGQSSHGSTFGGNFLVTSAALATLKEIGKNSTLKNVERQGTVLRNGLEELAAHHRGRVKEIRGLGLLVGLELREPVAAVQGACGDRGLLLGTAGPNTLRFAPSLLCKSAEIRQALVILDAAMEVTA